MPAVASWSEELSRWPLPMWAENLFVMSISWEGLVERCKAFESALTEPQLDLYAKSQEVLPNRWVEEPHAPPQIRAGPLQVFEVLPVLRVSLGHERGYAGHSAGVRAPGHEDMGQVMAPLGYQMSVI